MILQTIIYHIGSLFKSFWAIHKNFTEYYHVENHISVTVRNERYRQMKNKKELQGVLELLPIRMAENINDICKKLGSQSIVNEIRLRLDRPASLTVDGKNITLPVKCNTTEIKGAILALTGGSPYAYSETIKNGYIPQKNGVRCGVCPRSDFGGAVDEITSLCIRLPYEIEVQGQISELCKKNGKTVSTLLYSPPGIGKTTVLRMLIKKLCSGETPLRAAVIDTKHELYTASTSADTLTDYLFGFSKGEGIELALRSLSPEVVFCDEIGSQSDADSILTTTNTGVPLIVAAHADSFDSLLKRPHIKRLYDNNVFARYVLISRKPDSSEYEFHINEA